jgi:hypothetical protein
MVKDIGPLRTTMKNKVIPSNVLRLPSRPCSTLHNFSFDKWPRICSVCCNHTCRFLITGFVAMGITCGARAAYSSGVHGFNSCFKWDFWCSIFCFVYGICRNFFPFPFGHGITDVLLPLWYLLTFLYLTQHLRHDKEVTSRIQRSLYQRCPTNSIFYSHVDNTDITVSID